MKLKDIISRIDTSQKDEYVELGSIAQECGVYEYLETSSTPLLQSYFFHKWYCTDTYVGWRAYFLDGECVCVSSQLGRKCDEEFEWSSKELFLKTRIYILSLVQENIPEPVLANLDEELGEGQQIEFSSQFLTDNVVYIPTGQNVVITDRFPKLYVSKQVEVKFPDGRKEIVPTFNIMVPYNIH